MTIEIPAESFAQRIAAEPVLVDPNRVAAFGACLADLTRHEHFQDFMQPAAINDDGFWPTPGDWMARYRPYNVIDGVLQIPVMGALINRMGYQIGRYATGYSYIERAFERGLADSMVKGIAFVIDSPGGEAAGNFELVDKLYAGRGQKPMAAFVADMAFSGGYSIATAAPTINITRSGATGSVGVVTMHVDVSEALSQAGIKVTFIKAGAHKVDGNSYEPL
ncbi:MAG: S49 family peptidase, partial [Geminicoccaceae bacterium]